MLQSERANSAPDDEFRSIVFGRDFSGRSFVDVGSRYGDLCFEALRRGARKSLGIELDAERVQVARLRSKAINIPAEFICEDVEELDTASLRFDVVSCRQVLHHLYNPLSVLQKLMSVTKERLIIEFALPGIGAFPYSVFNSAARATGMPVIWINDPRNQIRALDQSFLFTKSALSALINGHSAVFDPVEFHKSRSHGLAILSARKRQIGECLIIAGPTSSGKSTLIGNLARFRDHGLQLPDAIDQWPVLRGVRGTIIGRTEKLILHYDILRPFWRSLVTINRDPAIRIFDVCERLRFVTIMPCPTQLRRQYQLAMTTERRIDERKEKIGEAYSSSAFLKGWYAAWFSLLERLAPRTVMNEILVSTGHGFRVVSGATWQDVFEELHGKARGASDARA